MAGIRWLASGMALVLGLVVTTVAAGGDGTVTIDSRTIDVGQEGTVTLAVADFPHLLGAWMIDIEYDPAIVQPVECTAEYGGLCDLEHGPASLRITSASAEGLTGNFVLATVRFTCGAEGSSALSVALANWGVGTVGFGPPPPETLGGSISCVAPPADAPELPATGYGSGSGTGDGRWHWLIAGLAFTGIMAISVMAARRILAGA